MRAISILSRLFSNGLKSIHLSRLKALFFGVDALLSGGRLSLTALGRAARGKTAPKHSIKRIDRLLGNRHLPAEIRSFGHAMAQWLLGSQKLPLVLVDWTLIGPIHNALVAAIPCDGRALPIYFEVHGRDLLANRKIENRFLERLRDVLPANCRPTLVTDAGFRNP